MGTETSSHTYVVSDVVYLNQEVRVIFTGSGFPLCFLHANMVFGSCGAMFATKLGLLRLKYKSENLSAPRKWF